VREHGSYDAVENTSCTSVAWWKTERYVTPFNDSATSMYYCARGGVSPSKRSGRSDLKY
jgi:hypothetical protein